MPAARVAMRRVREVLRLFSGMSKHEIARCTGLAASTVLDTIAHFKASLCRVVITARTDARATEGFDTAINRAGQYVEAPRSIDEVRRTPRLLGAPQILNMVVSGKMPIGDLAAATAMGFSLVLCANTRSSWRGAGHGGGGCGPCATTAHWTRRHVLSHRSPSQRLIDAQRLDIEVFAAKRTARIPARDRPAAVDSKRRRGNRGSGA
jgi:hypothetical protein